jgi:hypothetical protein
MPFLLMRAYTLSLIQGVRFSKSWHYIPCQGLPMRDGQRSYTKHSVHPPETMPRHLVQSLHCEQL